MNRRRNPSSPPRWGFVATWILGVAALLGTLAATLGRVMEARAGSSERAAPEAAEVLAPPDRSIAVRHRDADRVDTFPEVLGVGHAVEIDEGWVVLDAGGRRVHVIPDAPTAPLRSFGREGDGPGELRFPSRVAVSGSQIGVLEARGDRLVRYGRDGTVHGPVSLVHEACGFGPARALLESPGGGFLVLRSCTAPDGRTRALLLEVDVDGRVRVRENRLLQSLRSDAVDPYATPVVAVLEGGTYLGLLSDGCLSPVADDRQGASGRAPLCASADPRVPLPDSTRARFEALAERMEAIGGTVAIPDALPPFTDVRTTRAGVVLQVPLPDGRQALDLLRDGGRRTRFLADAPRGTFIGRRHLLLVRDLMEGTELAWMERDG